MTANIQSIFNAGRVRRWHMNADLSCTDDFNDAHQGRVARLILALHPNPRMLLIAAALSHDDGEFAAGDLAGDVKRANPNLYAALQNIEDEAVCEIWDLPNHETPCHVLPKEDLEWLKFADSLDAYMWMMHRKPALSARPDWTAQYQRLREFAIKHNIWDAIKQVF